MNNHLISSESLIGGRKEQQDSYGTVNTKFGLFVIVCDGMGGAKAGNIASKMAVKIVIDSVIAYNGNTAVEEIKLAIKKANWEIFNLSNNNSDFQGMGTTLAALLISKDFATTFHVGDSRVYQFKDSNKYFRTFDHSKVFDLVKLGVLTEEQARVSSESNVILRALGIKKEIDIEINDSLPYEKGDRFLICSDGISGTIPEIDLIKMMTEKNKIDEVNKKITQKIDLLGRQNGGHHDNLTSVIVETRFRSKIKTPLNMKSKRIIAILIFLFLITNTFSVINHIRLSENINMFKLKLDSLNILLQVSQKNENKKSVSKSSNVIQEKKQSSIVSTDYQKGTKPLPITNKTKSKVDEKKILESEKKAEVDKKKKTEPEKTVIVDNKKKKVEVENDKAIPDKEKDEDKVKKTSDSPKNTEVEKVNTEKQP